MSAEGDRRPTQDGDGPPEAPVLVLPGAGTTTTQGLGSGGGAYSGAPVIPELVVSPDDAGPSSGNLADRIEQALAEDGRFTALLPSLSFTTDSNGHVTLSGALQDGDLRPSLLATLRALPGVTQVRDETR